MENYQYSIDTIWFKEPEIDDEDDPIKIKKEPDLDIVDDYDISVVKEEEPSVDHVKVEEWDTRQHVSESCQSATAGKEDGSKRRGACLKSQTREIAVNVREFFEKEKHNGGPFIPLDQVVERTAAACKISVKAVMRVVNEKKISNDEKNTKPSKKRSCEDTKSDTVQEDSIRRHIYAYYERMEQPKRQRLVASLKKSELFYAGPSSLYHLLKRIGFVWKKFQGNKKFLIESNNIVAWRARFTRDVFAVLKEQIIWIGIMNINTGNVLLHAGSVEGFVQDCKFLVAKEITHVKFTKWFKEQLLPNLESERLIVIENASYNNVQKEKYPTMADTKVDIISWLKSKGIEFDQSMNRYELLEIVKTHKPLLPIYEIDEIAKEHGHKVTRVPPCHSHFNSIEMIWSRIKSGSNRLRTSDVKKKIDDVSSEDWNAFVEQTLNSIKAQSELDRILDQRIDEMISSLSSSSSSELEDSDTSNDEFSQTEESFTEERKKFKLEIQ